MEQKLMVYHTMKAWSCSWTLITVVSLDESSFFFFFFLKQMEDYVLYEQMVREILMEGNGGDGSAMAATATGGTEAQIVGIKHW